jgi:low affinity Fe/Cu permease
MLSLHMKLNELLRALHEPDNHLINIERLSEEELRELHAPSLRRSRSNFACLSRQP